MIFSSCYTHAREEDPSTGTDRLVGTITKAEGRVIHEIDGKPAADVYGQWVGEALQGYQDALRNFHESQPIEEPINILGVTALRPIGRVPTTQQASGETGDATAL